VADTIVSILRSARSVCIDGIVGIDGIAIPFAMSAAMSANGFAIPMLVNMSAGVCAAFPGAFLVSTVFLAELTLGAARLTAAVRVATFFLTAGFFLLEAAVRVVTLFLEAAAFFGAAVRFAGLRVFTVLAVIFAGAAFFFAAGFFDLAAALLTGAPDFNLSRRRLMLDASVMPTALIAVVGLRLLSLASNLLILAMILSSSMPEPLGRPRDDLVAIVLSGNECLN